MSDHFRQAVVEAVNKFGKEPITLDDFKEMLTLERAKIVKHLETEKAAPGFDNHTIITVYTHKLELIDWVIFIANRIEIPKAKMREFL